jgi:hypothetical protein
MINPLPLPGHSHIFLYGLSNSRHFRPPFSPERTKSMDFIPGWMTSWYFLIGMGIVAAGLIGLLVFLRMRGTGEE